MNKFNYRIQDFDCCIECIYSYYDDGDLYCIQIQKYIESKAICDEFKRLGGTK